MFLFSTLFVFITPLVFITPVIVCYVISRFKEAKDKTLEFIKFCVAVFIILCFLWIFIETLDFFPEVALAFKNKDGSLTIGLDYAISIAPPLLLPMVGMIIIKIYIRKNYIDEETEEID